MPAVTDPLERERGRVHHVLENAWLLNPSEIDKVRPGDLPLIKNWLSADPDHTLFVRTAKDKANPALHLLRLCRNPDYFPFVCKYILNIEILPFQHLILKELWSKPFPLLIATRGGSKSFTLGLYAMLRLLLTQGCKVVVIGASFRQSKVIFDYMEGIWANAPVLRDLCGTGKNKGNREQGPRKAVDRLEMVIGDSMGLALPIGDGSKVRGQRAGYVISDEQAAIAEAIYQNVIRGFAAVSANPVANVKNMARVRILKQLGMWTTADEEAEAKIHKGNQAVMAGTADHDTNHFCKSWRLYHQIVESRGDKRKLMELFNGEIPRHFDWRDFSIIRLPVELLPEGFMDEKMVAQAKATMSSYNYLQEYGAVFSRDTNGFFRRSLLEKCVVGSRREGGPVVIGGREIYFTASLMGEPNVPHVIAVDPASEKDNFAVVVLALYPTHRRIVHCWTIRKSIFQIKKKKGLVEEDNFYGYCARKIRNLMKQFPCVRIAMDSQGGGFTIEQIFHEEAALQPGEQLIWKVPDPPEVARRKDEDNYPGLHILEMINFASAEWTSRANHGLRADFESVSLLFPHFDPASPMFAQMEDEAAGRTIIEGDEVIPLYDTLEDCVVEIEELKDELASIVITQTPSGRDHWDVPKMTDQQGKAVRVRKDRYSALLMANAVARELQTVYPTTTPTSAGGFAKPRTKEEKQKGKDGPLYNGPDWFVQATAGLSKHYGGIVRK